MGSIADALTFEAFDFHRRKRKHMGNQKVWLAKVDSSRGREVVQTTAEEKAEPTEVIANKYLHSPKLSAHASTPCETPVRILRRSPSQLSPTTADAYSYSIVECFGHGLSGSYRVLRLCGPIRPRVVRVARICPRGSYRHGH